MRHATDSQQHPLLTVSDLAVSFGSASRPTYAVDGVDFTVAAGQTVVLVGESGSGKSISALAVSRLLPPTARIERGDVRLAGEDLFALPENRMRDVRGAAIGMIFQEPQSSLNPVMTIGAQIGETLVRHKGLKGRALTERVKELLDAVGIQQPAQRMQEYPHQFSGGMKQRVMIAIALAGDPSIELVITSLSLSDGNWYSVLESSVVCGDRAADRIRLTAKALGPKIMTDDRRRSGIGNLVIGQEEPSGRWNQLKGLEVSGGHKLEAHRLRVAGISDSGRPRSIGGQRGEQLPGPLSVLLQLRIFRRSR